MLWDDSDTTTFFTALVIAHFPRGVRDRPEHEGKKREHAVKPPGTIVDKIKHILSKTASNLMDYIIILG